MLLWLFWQGVAVKTKDYLGRTAMQYASNEAAADFLEKRANQTIPYEGREYLQLRVDTEVRKGAGAAALQMLSWCDHSCCSICCSVNCL
jgi:hypothetical protein